ncbi:hypothetical protein [Acetobacter senegalensis]|uniref:hypothetical protein n=1 Tax=Acetobacter senegalensis TaxID=446692 RepID=UPI001D04E923|nr:hypothetical protein [Acetobacter senegalensis]
MKDSLTAEKSEHRKTSYFQKRDWLNLGTSSGIMLYEITKQRRAYQSEYKWRNKRGTREEPLPTVITPDHVAP